MLLVFQMQTYLLYLMKLMHILPENKLIKEKRTPPQQTYKRLLIILLVSIHNTSDHRV